MSTPGIRAAEISDLSALASLRRSYAEEQKEVSADTDADFSKRFNAWYHDTAGISRWQVAEMDHALVGLAHMFTLPDAGTDL